MDLASLFNRTAEAFASPKAPEFPAVPVFPEDSGNGQALENNIISRSSRISRQPAEGGVKSEPKSAQAGAGAGERAGARDHADGEREIREIREKLAGSDTCFSRSPSKKLKIERETGNPPGLRALLTLASDPDRQLAFDERAAFLEYECGLSRAEAEATAANEILPELPAQPQATASQPEAAPGRNSFSPDDAGLLLRSWHAGLASLSPSQAPCRDYRGDDWSRVYNDALAFLDTFGSQAEALGWQTSELWGVHPDLGTIRVDHCGALVLGSGPVRAITADAVYFNGGAYRRKPGHYPGVPIWEVRR